MEMADALIAGTCIEENETLVTANYNGPLVKTTSEKNSVNKSDFGCIPSQAFG